MLSHCLIASVVVVSFFSTGRLAHADELSAPKSERETEAERSNLSGADAYEAKNYSLALRRFQSAVELDPRPKYIFNLALAADRLEYCPLALASFERYLETQKNEAETPHSARAQKSVTRLRNECSAAGVYLPVKEAANEAPVAATNEAPVAATTVEPKNSPPKQNSRRRLWTVFAVSTGAVALASIGYSIRQRLIINQSNRDLAMDANDEDAIRRGEQAASRSGTSGLAAVVSSLSALIFTVLAVKAGRKPGAPSLSVGIDDSGTVGVSAVLSF